MVGQHLSLREGKYNQRYNPYNQIHPNGNILYILNK